MNIDNAFERCLTFINCQVNPDRRPGYGTAEQRPVVTVSRQTGSGAMAVAEALAEYLQKHGPRSRCPWTVFDRNLMDKVLEEHQLPARLSKFLPEDSISEIHDVVDELLGLHPPSWTIIHQTTETILHLAQLGNVVLIGRAANIILASLESAFHVRLVGSRDVRVGRIQKNLGLSRPKATELIRRTDRGRTRYVKKYFGAAIDDPLLYDLTINTDRFTVGEVAELIGEAALTRIRNPATPSRPQAKS